MEEQQDADVDPGPGLGASPVLRVGGSSVRQSVSPSVNPSVRQSSPPKSKPVSSDTLEMSNVSTDEGAEQLS